MKTKTNKLANYYFNGEAKDHEWLIDNMEMFTDHLHDEMRKNGYIPALDIDLDLTWEYDFDRNVCVFKGHAKGLKVGSRRSKKTMGYMSKEGIIIGREAKEVELV